MQGPEGKLGQDGLSVAARTQRREFISMESNHSFLRLKGYEHQGSLHILPSAQSGEGKLFPGVKQEHRLVPVTQEAKHWARIQVTQHLHLQNAAHSLCWVTGNP